MALLEDLTKGSISTLLVGVGVALVAPVVLPALATSLRPLTRTIVKGGVLLYDSIKETVAEAGEQVSDLVAEVRDEIEAEAAAEEGAGVGGAQKKKKSE